ncbi:MAG: hypothetical protein Q8K82_04590 [Gemmatimonadaceae bacterium]|nr:hypothetical protein [Gemmatimonadaceae bacterium]
MLFVLLLALLTVLAYFLGRTAGEYQELAQRHRELDSSEGSVEREDRQQSATGTPAVDMKTVMEDVGATTKRIRRRMIRIHLLTVVLALFAFARLVQLQYISGAVAHFEQVVSLSAPSLTATELLETRAQFAAIKSTDDYRLLLERLKKAAEASGRRIPEFDVW